MTAHTRASTSAVSSECTESVCERDHYITAECVVAALHVVVRIICNHEVLSLVQDIICSQCNSTCIIEEKLRDLGIPDELRFLWSRISVIPVVVDV